MYFQDGFQKPNPFSPDIAVSIDDVIEKKIDMMDAHVSQMYEWLPWVAGTLDTVPKDAAARRTLAAGDARRRADRRRQGRARQAYGAERGNAVRHAEAFEICEYGTRPDEATIRKLFPFLP